MAPKSKTHAARIVAHFVAPCLLASLQGACSSGSVATSPDAHDAGAGSDSHPGGSSDAGAPNPTDEPAPELPAEVMDRLRTLRYDDGPPPEDPSNRVADDPRAQLLGQRLFFDASLSGPLLEGDNDGSGGTLGLKGESGKVSCASCHVPADHFVDTRSPHRQISLAAEWTKRRTPTLLEVGFAPLYNWDGRRDSLWAQAIGVIESEREFNSSRLFVAERVIAEYGAEYAALFGEPPPVDDSTQFPQLTPTETGCTQLVNQDGVYYECRGKPGDNGPYDALSTDQQTAVTEVTVNAAKALGAYVRQLRCGEGRFDAWLDGDASALSASEQRGAALFVGRAQCIDCHSGPNLTDGKFHNVGLRPGVVAVAFTDTGDRGAAPAVLELASDPLSTHGAFSDGQRDVLPEQSPEELEGSFRTPTLRCIAEQPSFMHTGQFTSLSSVMSFFSRGGDGPGGYPGINELERLDLDETERADLAAFLGALMGPGPDPVLLSAPSAPPSLDSDGQCGFEGADGGSVAAFCETFDQAPTAGGRAGELDSNVWSGMRGMPSLHASLDEGFPIGPALVTDCRPDLDGQTVGPDRDALLCGPTTQIHSPHLMIAAAAQNYGMTAYRIRQPFDFTGRVGTINLDVNLSANALGGWAAIVLGEDPTPAPTFNFPERGSGPRNGVAVEFYIGSCNDANSIVPLIYTYANYVETTPVVDFDCAVPHLVTAPGALNHLSIRVGEGVFELWGWNASPDGLPAGEPSLLASQPLTLPFTRGYVSLVARNHATIKYWAGSAWLTRWDNVGFDGPVIEDTWEYSVPDPLTESVHNDGCLVDGECIWRGAAIASFPDESSVCDEGNTCEFEVRYHDAGYVIPGVDEVPLAVTIPGVELRDATRARLALAVDYPWFSWNDVFPPPTTFNLRYQVNGGNWHDRFVTEDELNAFAGDPDEGPGAGLLNQVIDLDVAELREGDNTLAFALDGAWTGSYRAATLGIDLVLAR
jgi:cytochrome c peroxidase